MVMLKTENIIFLKSGFKWNYYFKQI
jgi:hypothetical protein